MVRGRSVFTAMTVIVVFSGIFSQSSGELPSPPYFHGRLKNGLEYMIEERCQTDTIAAGIFIKGGANTETEELVGLTDLFASLLTKGTERMSAEEIAKILEGRGVTYSASADYLSIALRAYMPSEEFSTTFEMLGEMILHPVFKEDDIEKEKGLKRADLDTIQDIPQSLFYDEIYRSLFPHHPLGYYEGCTKDSLSRMNRESLESFFATHVAPNNILIVIVGNISHETAIEKIEEIFGSMHHKEITGTRFSDLQTSPPSGIKKRIRKRTTEPVIWLGFRTEGIDDYDRPALAALDVILGEFQMRLWNEIREKRGYAYWINIDSNNYAEIGIWGVSAGIQKKHLKEVEEIMKRELLRITGEQVSDEELDTAKRYLKTNLSRWMDINRGHFGSLSSAILEGRPLRTEEEALQRIDRITKDDIQNIAIRFFKDRNFSIFTLY